MAPIDEIKVLQKCVRSAYQLLQAAQQDEGMQRLREADELAQRIGTHPRGIPAASAIATPEDAA